MHIILNRLKPKSKEHAKKVTLGKLKVTASNGKIFECDTLENPWKNNKPFVSCVPADKYPIERHSGTKYHATFKIIDKFLKKLRDTILFHWGNWQHNTLGCILTGRGFTEGEDPKNPEHGVQPMILASKATFKEFRNFVNLHWDEEGGEELTLEIVDAKGFNAKAPEPEKAESKKIDITGGLLRTRKRRKCLGGMLEIIAVSICHFLQLRHR